MGFKKINGSFSRTKVTVIKPVTVPKVRPVQKPRIGPVLILGSPRSGTTALAYPFLKRNGAFTNELNIFCEAKPKLGVYNLLVNLYPDLATHRVSAQVKGVCTRLDKIDYKHQVYGVYELLQNLYNAGLRLAHRLWTAKATDHVYAPGKYDQCLWGEQCPDLIVDPSFPDVIKAWPEAKIIYIQRDGRDVIASHIRLGWTSGGILRLWDRWVKAYYESEAIPNILKLRQETLLSDPNSVVDAINKFLNLDVLMHGDYNIFVKRGEGENPPRPTDIPEHARVVLNKLGYL